MQPHTAAQSSGPAPKLEMKVVVLGDKGVGKTCFVLRFIEGYYTPNQPSTIGAFFLTKKFTTADGVQVKMQIWDTAGQERFRAMGPLYYRNASAAIVCFDITDEQSFDMMKDWVEELRRNVGEGNIMIAIACTKADLEGQRVVSRARAEEYAASIHGLVLETSAKENWGVSELFHRVAQKVVEARGPELYAAQAAQEKGMRISVVDAGRRKTSKGVCC